MAQLALANKKVLASIKRSLNLILVLIVVRLSFGY
jgi:hypothetical protein